MYKFDAIQTLHKAFMSLRKRDRKRLVEHAKMGTPILCGVDAYMYVFDGAAWPGVLACGIKLPKGGHDGYQAIVDSIRARNIRKARKLMEAVPGKYMRALASLNKDEVRTIMALLPV